jgi:hypothetical protein
MESQRLRRRHPGRRQFLALIGAPAVSASNLPPITVSINVLLDEALNSGKGLRPPEIARFNAFEQKAQRDFAVSGIFFELHVTPGAFLRTQGYSDIPEIFLARRMINLFVTETLGYDIDRDRTGGCSIGPRPRGPHSAPDPYYKIFLGLRDARENTFEHEYAHHFTLDTQRNPTAAGNFWADLRNDYWLWRQRNGVPITAFRACAHSEWARLGAPSST